MQLKLYFVGSGFRKFGQALIDIGAKYGKQNIEDILVSRRTLVRTTMPAEYEKIKAVLSKVLQENNLAFTTDLWTDEYSQRSFFTLSAHYINEDWVLTASVLATR